MGKWTAVEDSKLKDAVRTHGDKNWDAISTSVSSRTRNQYRNRWHNALNRIIGGASGRTGKWTAVEDGELKDAVQTYGGNNWAEIAALVSGRTKNQCYNRWYNALDPSIALTTGREGKWAEDEVTKLKDTVRRHGVKD
jgi:myb proto-oncogene protein